MQKCLLYRLVDSLAGLGGGGGYVGVVVLEGEGFASVEEHEEEESDEGCDAEEGDASTAASAALWVTVGEGLGEAVDEGEVVGGDVLEVGDGGMVHNEEMVLLVCIEIFAEFGDDAVALLYDAARFDVEDVGYLVVVVAMDDELEYVEFGFGEDVRELGGVVKGAFVGSGVGDDVAGLVEREGEVGFLEEVVAGEDAAALPIDP